MTPKCEKLVVEMNQLLQDPENLSFDSAARVIYEEGYEEGYVAGRDMARRLLRLSLGLAVPADLGD